MEQEKVEKLLRAKLKERGLKITQQRLLVLSTLAKSSGNHMAAEELYAQIQQQYPEIGLATVYRTLQLLYEMQLIDRITRRIWGRFAKWRDGPPSSWPTS